MVPGSIVDGNWPFGWYIAGRSAVGGYRLTRVEPESGASGEFHGTCCGKISPLMGSNA